MDFYGDIFAVFFYRFRYLEFNQMAPDKYFFKNYSYKYFIYFLTYILLPW